MVIWRNDRTTKQWFARFVYDSRTKETLLPVIKTFIRPGTKIISDHFASYVSVDEEHTLANEPYLLEMNYNHDFVNHSENFVDPVSGAHTNSIEGLWEIHIKRHIKGMRGVKTTVKESYLDEYMWRSWFFAPRSSASMYMAGLTIGIKRQYGL